MRGWVLLLGLAGVLGSCGCGSGDAEEGVTLPTPVPACAERFTPCGGDVVGSWELTESCVLEPIQQFSDECPPARLRTTEYEVALTADYMSDGTVVWADAWSESTWI